MCEHLSLALEPFLDTCALTINRQQFFAYVRRRMQLKMGGKGITLENALYLPMSACKVLLKVSENTALSPTTLRALHALQSDGCLVQLGVIKDANGDTNSPCSNELDWRDEFQVICTGEPLYNPQNLLVPTSLIHCSCTEWENLRKRPINTWFSAILKTHAVPLSERFLGEKLLGEWTHAILRFEQRIQNLEEWKAHREERMNQLLQDSGNSLVFQHLGQRALYISNLMAAACEELLGKHWELKCEWTLPDSSPYRGRIDLLAINAKEQRIVIVDYKTSNQAKFEPKKDGSCWQLILYGKALQKEYPKYKVYVWMVKPTGEKQEIPLDASDQVEQWIDEFKKTGWYEDLPELAERQLDELPLMYSPAKLRRWDLSNSNT
ncbi:MAG: PD-(D/E)XK nuclease family protein [Opitutales bacterium]|nr:PD-(D/E)XK nuclease family protein [Opitutales bacterium]